jgi:hypothetical protein
MDISSILWLITSLLTGFIIFYFYKEYETYHARELLKARVLYFIAGVTISGIIFGSASQKNKTNVKRFKSFN